MNFRSTQTVDYEFTNVQEVEGALRELSRNAVLNETSSDMHLDLTHSVPELKVRTEVFQSPQAFYNWLDDIQETITSFHGKFKRCTYSLFPGPQTIEGEAVIDEDDKVELALPAVASENNLGIY